MSFLFDDQDSRAADGSLLVRMKRLGLSPSTPSEEQRAAIGGALRKTFGFGLEHLNYGLTLASEQLRRGNSSNAFRIYVALTLIDPMKIDHQVGLANCALQLGEYHLAVQAASVVIALDPSDYRGYYLSGRASLGLRRRKDAIEDLTLALERAKAAGASATAEQVSSLLTKLSVLAGSESSST